MSASKEPGNIFDGTQRQLKQKEGKQQQQANVKLDPSLAPPYAQKWPEIQKQHHKMIIDEINITFQNKVTNYKVEKLADYLKKKNPDESKEDFFKRLKKKVTQNRYNAGKDFVKMLTPFCSNSKYLYKRDWKEHMTFGYKDISKAIEKNQKKYSLVICSSDESTKLICQDLLCQCLLNNIPICAVNGFGDKFLLDWLDFKHMSAIGFHKYEEEANIFNDLIEFVIDKIPDTPTPWMSLWKNEENKTEIKTDDSNIDNDKELSENRKRKRDQDNNNSKGSEDVTYIEPNIEWVQNKKKSGVNK